MAKCVGKRFRFDYPAVFVTLPDYTAHAGQTVLVTRRLRSRPKGSLPAEYDYEGDAMYRVRADDGWEGSAWASELEPVE